MSSSTTIFAGYLHLTPLATQRLAIATTATLSFLLLNYIISKVWIQQTSISQTRTQGSPNASPKQDVSIPSPLTSCLPHLTPTQIATLAYPPNYLPGARDVNTPYGSMRVNEWGPENGRKIIFLHGDATPSPLFEPIAKALVGKGCRVMTLDLWGRGYTDSPLNHLHDSRLFDMQIYFALASSPISWTGTGQASPGFDMVGFSMGGAISMDFASLNPHLINSLVLLGPAGLIKRWPLDYGSWVFRAEAWLPDWYLRRRAAKLLGLEVGRGRMRTTMEGVAPEVPEGEGEAKVKTFDAQAAVQWTFDNHQGFLHSFLDTIKHAPILAQQETWRKVFRGMQERTDGTGLQRILFVFGEEDFVIDGKVYKEELRLMPGGGESATVKWVPGGHGFPMAESERTLAHIVEFWGL